MTKFKCVYYWEITNWNKNSSDGFLLPRVVSKEKHIVLPVDKYKLPAWSIRVIQLTLNAEHLTQFLSKFSIIREPGDVQGSPHWSWLVNLNLIKWLHEEGLTFVFSRLNYTHLNESSSCRIILSCILQ